MILTIVLLSVLSAFVLYNTSKRAVLGKSAIEKQIQAKQKASKIIGVLFLVAAMFLSAQQFGLGIGVCMGVILIMTVFSLTIVLIPLANKK